MRTKATLIVITMVAVSAALVTSNSKKLADGSPQSLAPDNTGDTAPAPSAMSTARPAGPATEPEQDHGKEAVGIILIDGDNAAVPAGDILYTFVSRQRGSCGAEVRNEFDLDPDTRLVQSDGEGRVDIPLPGNSSGASDCLVIQASKTGYTGAVVALDLTLQAGKNSIVELELARHRTVQGKTITPDGRGAGGADVKAWIADYRAGEEAPSFCAMVDEDSLAISASSVDGSFVLDLPGGNLFCVQASHPDWASSAPEAIDLSRAGPYDLVLELQQPLSLSGRVSDQEEKAVTGLTLQLRQADVKTVSAVTDGDGRFLFDKLEAAHYQLSSADPAYAIARPTEIALDRNQSNKGIEVNAFPLTTITGRVVDQAGQPVAGVHVSTRSPYLPGMSSTSAFSDRNGWFEVRSEHRSKAVHDMLRMAGEFKEADSAAQHNSMPAVSCVSFYHPRFRGQERAVSTAEPRHELGTVYLEPPLWEFSGLVTDHRGEALAASLRFEYIDKGRNASSDPPTRCEQSAAPRPVQSDEQGRFQLHVDKPGRYEVQVQTARYKTRRITLDLSQPGTPLQISLD